MKKCIICQNWIPDDAKRCETCGFPARRWFLSKHHYASWMEQTVIPYRKQWETREEEKQRKEEIQPAETENEQTTEKTAEIPAAVSKPKKKLRGLMAAIVAVVIFAAGIGVGVGVATGMANADAEKDPMIEVIAGMPDPRLTAATLEWLDENSIPYTRGTGGYTADFGAWNAEYSYLLNEWGIYQKNDSASENYKALKKQLEKEGYILVGEENDGQVKYAGEKTELTLRYDSEQNTLVIRITTSS